MIIGLHIQNRIKKMISSCNTVSRYPILHYNTIYSPDKNAYALSSKSKVQKVISPEDIMCNENPTKFQEKFSLFGSSQDMVLNPNNASKDLLSEFYLMSS